MSAQTERILEEIKLAEDVLATAQASGDTVGAASATLVLKHLREHFSKATSALNEGKQTLLKG